MSASLPEHRLKSGHHRKSTSLFTLGSTFSTRSNWSPNEIVTSMPNQVSRLEHYERLTIPRTSFGKKHNGVAVYKPLRSSREFFDDLDTTIALAENRRSLSCRQENENLPRLSGSSMASVSSRNFSSRFPACRRQSSILDIPKPQPSRKNLKKCSTLLGLNHITNTQSRLPILWKGVLMPDMGHQYHSFRPKLKDCSKTRLQKTKTLSYSWLKKDEDIAVNTPSSKVSEDSEQASTNDSRDQNDSDSQSGEEEQLQTQRLDVPAINEEEEDEEEEEEEDLKVQAFQRRLRTLTRKELSRNGRRSTLIQRLESPQLSDYKQRGESLAAMVRRRSKSRNCVAFASLVRKATQGVKVGDDDDDESVRPEALPNLGRAALISQIMETEESI